MVERGTATQKQFRLPVVDSQPHVNKIQEQSKVMSRDVV
jgi:hypothetical protein